jgi:hypothetical protein
MTVRGRMIGDRKMEIEIERGKNEEPELTTVCYVLT